METFSALLAICAGNSAVPGEFPAQRPVTRSLKVFFDLRLNKRLSKQSWGWWFETLPSPLWRHCNGTSMVLIYMFCPGPGFAECVSVCQSLDYQIGRFIEKNFPCTSHTKISKKMLIEPPNVFKEAVFDNIVPNITYRITINFAHRTASFSKMLMTSWHRHTSRITGHMCTEPARCRWTPSLKVQYIRALMISLLLAWRNKPSSLL